MSQMFYHTALGKAVLRVEGRPLKRLGQFKTEAEAKAACDKHYAKACKAAENFGRDKPQAFFM